MGGYQILHMSMAVSLSTVVQMPLSERKEGMGFQISFTCKIICICKSAKISALDSTCTQGSFT